MLTKLCVNPYTTWVTADTHFEHGNMIRFLKRPFSSVDNQRDTLIEYWNVTVPRQDGSVVLHLGDFNWGQELSQIVRINRLLHGTKYLVPGNHDPDVCRAMIGQSFLGFQTILPQGLDVYFAWEGKERHLVISHYAGKTWNKSHHGSLMLYGHNHAQLPEGNDLSTDVGVDARNFRPVLLADLVKELDDREARLRSEGKNPFDPWGVMKEKWIKGDDHDK